ncbi:MAG: hypothetical protein HZB29_09765 [Nitrospinae bacterium]|nr:hypothetical protein [Nitrospinota bacterium]
MKRILTFIIAALAAGSLAGAYDYGSTPKLTLPKTGEGSWGPKIEDSFKKLADFNSSFANPDGTLKATATATPWQSVTSTVTYVSTTQLSVNSSLAAYFETGRKAWVTQSVQAIGVVTGTSTVGGVTTVTLGNIVQYTDNATPATLSDPITSVSVSMVTPRSATLGNTVGGGYSGLLIANNTTNPSYQMGISASEITLDDGTYYKNYHSVAVTADITAAGANGRDTGSEAASTWYYIWIIGKADGTVASLLSTSSTAPAMPSGYTYKRRVGAIYNDASSNFWRTLQTDNTVRTTHAFNTGVYLSAGTATTYTLLTPIAPPTSRLITVQFQTGGATSTGYFTFSLDGATDTFIQSIISYFGVIQIPLNTSGQHYYKRASGTDNLYLYVIGWVDNL